MSISLKSILLFILVAMQLHAQNLNDGLVAYFPFNGNANDNSPLGIDGIVTNAVLTNDSDGIPNSAYNFDGDNDHICAGTNNRGITNKMTITAWFRTSSSNYQHIVGKYIHTEDKGYHLIVKFNKVHLAGRDGNGSYQMITYDEPITDGQWHCVVGVIDNNIWQLWVDCSLKTEINTLHSTTNLTTTQPLCIGQFFPDDPGGHYYFNGDIDEVRLYNRPLVEEEIMLYCKNEPFEVNLPPNITLCNGENILLNATPNISGIFSYLWQDGSTSATFLAEQIGTYTVQVSSNIHCPRTYSTNITYENQTVNNPITICSGEVYTIGSNTYSQSGIYTDILTAENGCDSIVITQLTVTQPTSPDCNDNNCNTTDSFNNETCACQHETIAPPICNDNNPDTNDTYNTQTCTCEYTPIPTSIIIPNAFSPNNDNINDLLRPIGNGIATMHLVIYNRWGQVIFESKEQSKGWDGKFESIDQEIGVYVYRFSYSTVDAPDTFIFHKGNITLIK